MLVLIEECNRESAITPAQRFRTSSSYDVQVEKLAELSEGRQATKKDRPLGYISVAPSVFHNYPPPTIWLSKITGKPIRKYERKLCTSSGISSQPMSVDLNNVTARAALDDRITNLVEYIDSFQGNALFAPKCQSKLSITDKENATPHPSIGENPASTSKFKCKF